MTKRPYFYCIEQLHLSNINFDFAANEMIYSHRIFLKAIPLLQFKNNSYFNRVLKHNFHNRKYAIVATIFQLNCFN